MYNVISLAEWAQNSAFRRITGSASRGEGWIIYAFQQENRAELRLLFPRRARGRRVCDMRQEGHRQALGQVPPL